MLSPNGKYGSHNMKIVTMPNNNNITSFVSFCVPIIAVFFVIRYIYRDGTISLSMQFVDTVLALLGAILILHALLSLNGIFWRIRYNDREFIYTTIFGLKTKVSFADIWRTKRSNDILYFYDKNRRFHVDLDAAGAEDFVRILSKYAEVLTE